MVKAQLAMVMNLDKCIGCNTCSVTCKNTWTNRRGAEYMWFNNVETKPGVGYPRRWEDQGRWRGGWVRRKGELGLRAGGRAAELVSIFYNPNLPTMEDYYEPWTYDYNDLVQSPAGSRQPAAQPRSAVSGERMEIGWGPNWEDDLAGAPVTAVEDPNLRNLEREIAFRYEEVFQLYLPRLCSHCLNPACVAACPSGAVYKREEDGIVLVDQQACRGFRFCVSGCPYKKVYFNWQAGKAEKCLFCYPRTEEGEPTICAATCVGRMRYLGVMLYDAAAVPRAAAAEEGRLLEKQRSVFLDPRDPAVVKEAVKAGIPKEWIDAAGRSPVYKLVMEWQLALPLHPEYRTLPMVWYIPPLSPLAGPGGEDLFAPVGAMRIPVSYLANLFTAGDPGPVRLALERLARLRRFMREAATGGEVPPQFWDGAGLDRDAFLAMYRLLALADRGERFVVPEAHREEGREHFVLQGTAGLDFEGGKAGG